MRRTLAPLAVALLSLAYAGAAAAGNGGIAPVAPKSPNTERISDLYYVLLAVTGAIFVLVEGALLLFVFRFRARGRSRDVEGPQITGHTRLELIWTAVPVVILAGIVGFVFYKLPGIKNVPSASAAGSELRLRVEGHQFYWRYIWSDGTIAFDRLVAPLDQPVRVEVDAHDVIHSWWVPALAPKIDAIPGRVNHTWFQPKREGTYKVRCAEFCGIQHAQMLGTVRVVSEADFERYRAERRENPRTIGSEAFEATCAKCHGLKGEGGIGPVLAGNANLQNRDTMESIIRNGVNTMPPVGKNWTTNEIHAVIDYLQQNLAKAPSGE